MFRGDDRDSEAYFGEDVRATLFALGASARATSAQSPATEVTAAWLHGYESALAAVAVALRIGTQPRTRREARQRGGRNV